MHFQLLFSFAYDYNDLDCPRHKAAIHPTPLVLVKKEIDRSMVLVYSRNINTALIVG